MYIYIFFLTRGRTKGEPRVPKGTRAKTGPTQAEKGREESECTQIKKKEMRDQQCCSKECMFGGLP